jgi:hypothetical protein
MAAREIGAKRKMDQNKMPLVKPRSWSRRVRLAIIAGVTLVAAVVLISAPRVPLDAHYHDFADTRTIFDIPNALDVLSNIPFLIVGLWGVCWLLAPSSRTSFSDNRERIPYLVFFAGVAFTGAGSLWYHLAPSDARLPWDLLPMTCSFVSMVVVTFMERISVRVGIIALLPLLLLGIGSVGYWSISESHGHGDYKFYLFVQFFSPVVLAMIVAFFSPRYTGMRYLVLAFCLFVAAKLFELFDGQIYGWGTLISGHTLKHLTAGVSCYWILRMLQVRRTLTNARMREPAIESRHDSCFLDQKQA